MTELLQIKNLTVTFGQGDYREAVLEDFSLSIEKGKTTVLLGESGSGKSITALAIMRLLPNAANIQSGEILLEGNNLLSLSSSAMRHVRGAHIGMVFQEPQTSLNPVMTIGEQIKETLKCHKQLTGDELTQQSLALLESVGILEGERRLKEYPHQFSGGMKQRIMIAMALTGEPDILIADEPTTALDVTIQAQILSLLNELQQRTGMAMLFITHDFGVAYEMADDIAVMQSGHIVELKDKETLFKTAKHPYTLKLLNAIPNWQKRQVTADNKSNNVLMSVRNIKCYYPIYKGIFKRVAGYVKAVDEVSFDIHQGEVFAVIGESGSGKTTMGKCILQLIKLMAGEILYQGKNLNSMTKSEWRKKCFDIQIIFQDPYASMNPRMMIKNIIEEGIKAKRSIDNPKDRDDRVVELLLQVGLLPEHRYRYPHEFSGGQRQRVCIARALAVEPKLIICDEPTSALDVSVQAQILELLKSLKQEKQISYLLITHNIGVVEYIADTVAVMYQGKIVEQNSVEQLLFKPQHPYTKQLLAAIPNISLS